MKPADQYPITTGYGCLKGYPLNPCKPGYGYHRGQDRQMPVGTPVIVNGVTIGLSGNTGASTGPHLHIGKWISNQVQHPQGGGFTLSRPAKVIFTGYNSTNGNFVRVQDATGAVWIYLHLSKINVSVGQVLDGQGGQVEDKIRNQGEADLLFQVALHKVDHAGAAGFIGMRWVDALTLIAKGTGPGSHNEQDQKLTITAGYTPEGLKAALGDGSELKQGKYFVRG